MSLKALVVGCGSIGRRHLANLMRSGSGPVAVCDPDPAIGAAVVGEFAVPVFDELDAALAWDPDAVFVCTPTHLHAQVALAALDTGAHLFVEKPIALDLAGAKAIAVKAAEGDRVVLVGCNMRFHPAVRHLRALVEAGELGDLQLISAHFSHYLPNWRPGKDYRTLYSARAAEGGGVLMEAIHEIDYVAWLGDGFDLVGCVGGRVSSLEIDAEDVAVVFGRLGAGGAGLIKLDYLRPEKSRGTEIVGTRALVQWLSEGKAPERMQVRILPAGERAWRTLLDVTDYDANDMYEAELDHFLRCIRGEERPALDAEGGARVLETALAARCQLRRDAKTAAPIAPRG